MAAAVLLLSIIGFGVSTALENRRAEAIETTVNNLYSEAFPGAPVPSNTVGSLRGALEKANDRAVYLGVYPGNLSALDVLSEISRRVPPDLDIIFEEVNIDRRVVRMKVYAKKFESADRLGAELAKFEPFARAKIGSIESDPKRGGKRFTVTISLSKPERSS